MPGPQFPSSTWSSIARPSKKLPKMAKHTLFPSSLTNEEDSEGKHKHAPSVASRKVVRFICTDPDATESSSDEDDEEEDVKRRPASACAIKVKRVVREIVVPLFSSPSLQAVREEEEQLFQRALPQLGKRLRMHKASRSKSSTRETGCQMPWQARCIDGRGAEQVSFSSRRAAVPCSISVNRFIRATSSSASTAADLHLAAGIPGKPFSPFPAYSADSTCSTLNNSHDHESELLSLYSDMEGNVEESFFSRESSPPSLLSTPIKPSGNALLFRTKGYSNCPQSFDAMTASSPSSVLESAVVSRECPSPGIQSSDKGSSDSSFDDHSVSSVEMTLTSNLGGELHQRSAVHSAQRSLLQLEEMPYFEEFGRHMFQLQVKEEVEEAAAVYADAKSGNDESEGGVGEITVGSLGPFDGLLLKEEEPHVDFSDMSFDLDCEALSWINIPEVCGTIAA